MPGQTAFSERSETAGNLWAEREGFEPSGPCGPPVFKTGAFVRSATAPGRSLEVGTVEPAGLARGAAV